ncbi:MAG: lipid-A-disaccharide synthase [Gammaproteobacteria bacterium]
MPRIVVIAGEASGDRLGASFIRSAVRLRPDLTFEGVAGPEMRAAGCKPWFDAQDLAVMGLFEVIRHLPRILRIKREVQKRLLADPPDVLLGIDAPDFNLRVEKVARRAGIPTVHYVCPSVWAWRESRVKTIRKACDRVLCLLPFEVPFLKRHNVEGRFVGHPLADDIDETVDRPAARRKLSLDDGPVIAILPGSRGGEVTRIGPAFAETAAWIHQRRPGIAFVIPAATVALRELIEQQFAAVAPQCEVHVVDGNSFDVLAACDAALLASGTVTLESMLMKRPMVVAYKLSPMSYWVGRIFRLIKVKYMSLPNLLADGPLVPEFLQGDASPDALGGAILELLDSPDGCADLIGTFGTLHRQMRRSAGERSAIEVLDVAGLDIANHSRSDDNASCYPDNKGDAEGAAAGGD